MAYAPYTPPEGSYIELLPDGTFRLEGDDTTFTQDDEVSVHTPLLVATKEPGEGRPLSLHLFRGAKPIHVQLCYGDLDKSGIKQWHRDAPNQSGTPTKHNPKEHTRALPQLRVNENWFRIGFFVFLCWYLFVHHQVFRGVDATERYPVTVPDSSPDGDDYVPPQHIFR